MAAPGLRVGAPCGAATSQQPLSEAAWKRPASGQGCRLHFHSNLNIPLSTCALLKAGSLKPGAHQSPRMNPLPGLCPVPPKVLALGPQAAHAPRPLALSLRGAAAPGPAGRVSLVVGEASWAAHLPAQGCASPNQPLGAVRSPCLTPQVTLGPFRLPMRIRGSPLELLQTAKMETAPRRRTQPSRAALGPVHGSCGQNQNPWAPFLALGSLSEEL